MPTSSHNESSIAGARPRQTQIEFHCLGPFEILVDGLRVRAYRSENLKCLLAYLVAEANQAHPRDALAALLWPDEPGQAARHNLRQTLYQFSQILGAEVSAGLLRATRDSICLIRDERTRYDVAEFQAHLSAGRLPDASAAYRGEFLSDLSAPSEPYAAWLEHQRSQLHRQACDALNTLAGRALAEHAPARAQVYAGRHLALDALADSAHRHMIQAHLLAGNPAGALTHYRAYEAQLMAEMGIAPPAELRALLPANSPAPGRARSPKTTAPPRRRVSLQEMPPAKSVFGREAELALLREWFGPDDCRLVAITGLGGMGKTTLASRLAELCAPECEVLIWRSLANAPRLVPVLQGLLAEIAPESLAAAETDTGTLLRELLGALGQKRCLIVLDNVESILEGGTSRQGYRAGYEDYGVLFQRVGESAHRSHLVLTSREQPHEVLRAEAGSSQVRTLRLKGLNLDAIRQLLRAHQLEVSDAAGQGMAAAYSGNPLAIKLVSHVIQLLYGGDAEAFLGDSSHPIVTDDVRRLIDSQFDRLTALERRVFFWLAIARVPVPVDTLWADMLQAVPKRELLDALMSLERRSLLEKDGPRAFLSNVVLEYGTDRLVEFAEAAVLDPNSDVLGESPLHTHALVKAQETGHIREAQLRLVMAPLVQRLTARLGGAGLEALVRGRVGALRSHPAAARAYAAGNLINLLICAGIDLRGLDCAGLTVRQADLSQVTLHQVNFSQSELWQCVFRQDFTVVKSLAFDPSGQRLAMGTSHGEIRVWNFHSDQLDWNTTLHSAFTWGLAFSPDGELLACGGHDGRVSLLSAVSGAHLRDLHAHPGEVTSVAFSPDGRLVYSACAQGVLQAAAVTGELCWERRLAGRIECVAISPDQRLLASSGEDGSIKLWDANTGAPAANWQGHTARSKGLAFSPDGALLASASDDYSVRLWDVASGQTARVLSGHTAWVWGVRFSPDGQLVASSGDDQTIRIWQANTGECVTVIRGHSHWVRPIAFHPAGRQLVSAADDQTVRMWDIATGQQQWMQQGYTNWIRAVAFNPADHTLAVATADHIVRVWRPEPNELLGEYAGHTNVVSGLGYSRDGRLLASAGVDASARLWNMAADAPRSTPGVELRGHDAQLYAVASNADGSLVATGSADHTAVLWHTQSGRILGRLRHAGKVYALAFTPDDGALVTASSSAALTVWDVRTRQVRAEWQAHRGSVYSIAVHPDGQTLASGSADNTIRLWDLATGRLRATLEGHSGTIFSLAFSPDGALLASGGYDRTVRLWDGRTGAPVSILERNAGFVRSVAFSADGLWLASGSADEWLRLWRRPGFELVRRFKSDPPYTGLNIARVAGLSPAQRQVLKTLGAVEAPG